MDEAATSIKPPRRLAEIDALRGLAAAGVVLFHYVTVFPTFFPQIDAFSPFVRTIFTGGSYGVLLFFAISGFVITMTLERTSHATDFIVRRFARLYPVYWAAILVTTITVLLAGETSLTIPIPAIFANFTMAHSLLYFPSVDGVYWSLLLELCFYACMLTLWLIGALKNPERVVIGWLAIKLLCAIVPFIPWRLQTLLVVEYIPFFLIGMLLHRIWSGQRSWRDQTPYLAACLVVLAIANSVSFALFGGGVILLLGAVITGRARFLNNAALIWLGGISYALYLIHGNFGFVVMLSAINAGVPYGATIIIAMVLSVVISAMLRRYIEVPSEKLIQMWWRNTPFLKAVR